MERSHGFSECSKPTRIGKKFISGTEKSVRTFTRKANIRKRYKELRAQAEQFQNHGKGNSNAVHCDIGFRGRICSSSNPDVTDYRTRGIR